MLFTFRRSDMQCVCSIDWCQYSCEFCRPVCLDIGAVFVGCRPLHNDPAPRYVVVADTNFSPQYSCSVALAWRKVPVAHVFFRPKQSTIASNRCIVKADNRLLYMRDWSAVFLDILRVLGAEIVSLSRLDVCCDFNLFANGMHPREFIRRYLSPPELEVPSYIRHASNKFRVYGQKNLSKDGLDAVADFQTLSFGSRDSAVQTNLYCKSEELRAKDKPWIRALWYAAGLNPEDVWRVEFSLNSRGVCVLLGGSTYIRELSIEPLSVESYVSDVFMSLARYYFAFHEWFAGDTRKLRSLPLAVLFDAPSIVDVRPRSINRNKQSGRTERLVYNFLRKMQSDADLSPSEMEGWSLVLEKLSKVQSCKQLVADWAEAPDRLIAGLAGSLMSKDALPVKGIVPLSRIRRLVELLMVSPSADVQMYKEAFTDFLWHAGVFTPPEYRSVYDGSVRFDECLPVPEMAPPQAKRGG